MIHEVTKVPANTDGIHGCICNIDGSCRMSQANGKVTCLGGFYIYYIYIIPVAEKAIIQEMEGVGQEALPRRAAPTAWHAAGKVACVLATLSLSSPP